MAFHVPLQNIWTPLARIILLWSNKFPKITCLLLYAALKLKPMCTRKLLHVSLHTSRNVHKNKKKWSFPQWVPNNLTIGLPYAWKRSELTLHYLLMGYILSLLDELKEENIWEQGNYSSMLPHFRLCLSLHPFVLLSTHSFSS